MKPIPEQFKKYGWIHTLVKRDGEVCLYRKAKIGDATGAEIESWDVIEVQRHGEFSLAGNIFPAAETYPPSESWGCDGFSYPTRERANVKFRQMTQNHDAQI